jgi:tyrosyl-tRNA synthetase
LSGGEWGELEHTAAAVRDGDGDPMALKQSLAMAVAERLSGAEGAQRAHQHFEKVVRARELPNEIPEYAIDLEGASELGLLAVLETVGLTKSRGEARRLVKQGAVQLDGERVEDEGLHLAAGSYLLKAGKRRFARVQLE